eukprot:snap_masked-scaffold_38-processed-gene-2.34-mRNA-1 protein AED:1.00 eAED:1.00 QI:0/-1/0/0/-1/1/1/0/194
MSCLPYKLLTNYLAGKLTRGKKGTKLSKILERFYKKNKHKECQKSNFSEVKTQVSEEEVPVVEAKKEKVWNPEELMLVVYEDKTVDDINQIYPVVDLFSPKLEYLPSCVSFLAEVARKNEALPSKVFLLDVHEDIWDKKIGGDVIVGIIFCVYLNIFIAFADPILSPATIIFCFLYMWPELKLIREVLTWDGEL